MNANPFVSVVIPVYNRPKELKRAVSSVLSQDYKDFELIVVDDGSDKEPDLDVLSDNIKLIKHEQNRGAAAARNTGITAASGEYIAFLDSDDQWRGNKLRLQMEFMKQKRYKASCTGFAIKKHNVDKVKEKTYQRNSLKINDVIWGCFIAPGSTLVVERDVFEKVGNYDSSFSRLEDWDWLIRFCTGFEMGLFNQPLSDIYVSGIPDDNSIKHSLSAIQEKHRDELIKINPLFGRQLDAAIMIEKAAQSYRKKRYVNMLYFLLCSLMLNPMENSPAFKEIILPHITAIR